jgi:hypothetical protein
MAKIFLALLILLFPTLSLASEPSANFNMKQSYRVYVKGIHIADLRAQVNAGKIQANIESYGLAKKISKYWSNDTTTYSFKNGQFVPIHYFTEFNQRQGGRTVEIKYDEKGHITFEQVIPPDNRQKRPAVDDKLKNGAFDPLTAAMIARQNIINSLKNGTKTFSMNFYDGRRLARLEFNIEGKGTININGKTRNVINVTFKRFPLEGFTNNELKRIQTEEPTFNMSLSDDELLIPLKADIYSDLGRAVLVADE